MVAHLTLFGKFDLRLADGSALDLPGQKDRALLAILAMSSGAALPRDKLTGLLWSDRGDIQARDSLKHALKHIRLAFNDAVPEQGLVTTDRHEVRLAADWISVDVKTFEGLIRKGTPDSLAEADRLVTGELLEGIVVNDAGFESWLLAERQRLRRLQEQALTKLLAPALDTGTRERAALKLLELDPTREAATRVLMQVHAERGESAQAVRLFEVLRDRLQIDLGIKPERETLDLYEAIRSGALRAAETKLTMPVGEPDPLSKPSIAVLPFTNMSNDPDQQYFSDGITEDIITELSRFHWLIVIARNSAFQFRGPSVDNAAIRRALGVRYIVEGSVRKAAGGLRVTAQLIDAVTQSHLWAERYDRDIQDIFAVQDEVTRAIVATLGGRIVVSGAEQSRRKPTKDWVAYDYFLQGRDCDYRYDIEQAIDFFRRATELDSNYTHAHAWLATQLCMRYLLDELPGTVDEAAAHAQRALSLDENDAYAQDSMGWVAMRQRQLDLAGQHFDRAVRLGPNDVSLAVDWANWLMYVGKLEEALRCLDVMLERDPYPPAYIWEVRGQALYFMKRYEEAISALRNMRAEHYWKPMFLAATFAQLGELVDARSALARLRKAKPSASVDSVSQRLAYADPAMCDHLLDGLRKAGLPE